MGVSGSWRISCKESVQLLQVSGRNLGLEVLVDKNIKRLFVEDGGIPNY